jgi:hypothetical protein
MSTKKTFESFVNSMNENVDLYKVYKKVSGKYSLRKPSYWGDLFNQRGSIPYRELTKYDKELHSLDVYTTKELGCHSEYPLQSNFKVQVPQVFVLYCNTESGELGEYYGMSILVNTEGATYPRYACGMPDFEPELHNFANGIPESYLNIVTTGAQLLHEQMIVEGQFSWLTSDTNTQIGSERQNMITVFMYDNMGNKWTEKDYEGYGSFGGMDYYDLVATMNGYTEEDVKTMKGSFKELRQLGIDLAFGKIKTKDKKKKTLFPALVEDPRFNWKRHDFTQEAESDPNQSWYQEEESDDDYDDDYENGWYESKVTEAQKQLTIKDVEKAWDSVYGEDFEYEYAGVYGEIKRKYKGKITKAELHVLWYNKYGEDLQDEHSGFLDKLEENLNEATVVMDAMDPKSKILKKLLKKHKVTMKVLDPSGPSGWPEVELTGSREDLQSVLADPNGWDDPELGEYIEESNILEARSINKISKEFGETVNKMKDIVKIYIAAEDGSDEKATTRQQLIDLTKKKKALTNELDDAVAGKNKDVKLVITEGVMSDIHQMIGNHKSFDTFQKEFFKEYGHKKVMKKTPEFLQWLKALYNDFEYMAGEAIEEKYTKKSLLKKLGDADDAMIQTGNGKEYIIYNPDSNNDDNAEMWHDKSVFAVDQDGEEHEIAYKDIGLVMVESVVNEALSKEQKMVETFLNKIAKEFDYSIQDAVRFVKETISKMGLDESVVNEAVSRDTKIYQIATPAPQSMLLEELEELFGDDYRNIVTEFKEDEGYESVLMFNLSKSDIKKIEDNIADVLIWEYSIKKGKKITESVVTEAKNDGNLDTIADYVKQVLDDGKSFMDIGKKLKGAYKYDFSTGMMPMYIIPVSGNKIVIINKKYVENGQADRVVGDIAIGLMESMVTEARGFKNDEDFEEFLKEIDAMPEREVRKIMGKEYIDTPGFYQDEKDNYDDVIDFMISNMGANIYHQLEQWWELNVMKPGLRESKIQIKRRYTDNHPAQTSGRIAKVRNAMIEALADGVLTEEEFNNILKEKSIDNKRWMRRNSKYFTVSENGIGLSKFGKRILTGIKPVVSLTIESFISEKADISGAYNDLEDLLGTDMETMDDFQRIENDGTWEEMSDFIEMAGDVEVFRRYKFKSQKDIDKLAKYIMGESVVNEANYIKFKGKKVDISSLEMEDVDMKDYPDFSDAYFSYGEYSNGKEMTDEELSDFTDDNGDLANELAHDSLH